MRRLLIRPGAIGDCILALPALEWLKAEYTEVWVPSAVVPLIRFPDRVRSIASTGLDLLELGRDDTGIVETLRGFDSIVSWYGSNRPEFRACVEGRGLPFRFLAALPPDESRMHAADFFLGQVGGTGAAIPRIEAPPVFERDFAAIHPFSGSPRKNWPLERFQELASGLSMPVRWCAGPEDPPLPNAVHIDNLYDLAQWLASARLYIGNDSGITHLAAAVGAAVVAIFGPTDPAIWAPRGPRVEIVRGPLDSLSTRDVLAAVESILA